MKGFFIKHGYQKTWRQTEMAKLCAPPRKKVFWPALLFLINEGQPVGEARLCRESALTQACGC
jgi:hypothetical protein